MNFQHFFTKISDCEFGTFILKVSFMNSEWTNWIEYSSRTFGHSVVLFLCCFISPLTTNVCSNSKTCQAEFSLKKQVSRTNIELFPRPHVSGLANTIARSVYQWKTEISEVPPSCLSMEPTNSGKAGEKCIKPSLSLTVPEMAHLAPNGRSGMHWLLEENYLLWEY